MSNLDYLGVRPCGCITAWLSDDHVTKAEVRSFYRDMADSGREVRRMTLADAKAQGEAFLPLDGCPHRAAASSRSGPSEQVPLAAAPSSKKRSS
jgi:hypothetical protein